MDGTPPADYFRVLQQRAATLKERYGHELVEGTILEVLPLQQLIQWHRNVATNDPSSFIKRLSWFQKDPESLQREVNTGRRENHQFQRWTEDLPKILDLFQSRLITAPRHHSILQKFPQVPFQEILLPFLEYSTGLLEKPGALPFRFSGPALSQQQHQLLKELSGIASWCFEEWFRKFLEEKSRSVKRGPLLEKKIRDEYYRQFVQYFYKQGAPYFFEQYSALTRLLITCSYRWVLGLKRISMRLHHDYEDLRHSFFSEKNTGPVISIKGGLSAPHSTEGSTAILRFESGDHLVYKPRSGETDQLYNQLIAWLNATGKLHHLRPYHCLNRGAYSWHEYLPYGSCKKEGAVRNFYRRTGYFAALLEILGSRDYHIGNLLACGEHPVLCDNETILHPLLQLKDPDGIPHLADREQDWKEEAVSHFLTKAASNTPSGVFGTQEIYHKRSYYPVNQDTMRGRRRPFYRAGRNIAKLQGRKVHPQKYTGSILQGYTEAVRLIGSRATDFHRCVEVATNDFQMKVRLLVRPTVHYANLLQESLRPDHLRSGVLRSLFLEQAAPFYLGIATQEDASALLEQEITALEEQLIPRFEVRIDQRNLTNDHQSSDKPGIISKSARQVFEERLEAIARKR